MRSPEFGNRQIEDVQVASFRQSSGEGAPATAHHSPLASEAGLELLRELNNAFAAVLINAQVLDGKLPSYSRSKRYIHEIERSAQRGGALLKRLFERLPAQASASFDGESVRQRLRLPSNARRCRPAKDRMP